MQEHGGSFSTLDKYVIEQLSLIKPKIIVDFGAGGGKYGKLARELFDHFDYEIVAVEGFEPSVEYLNKLKIYKTVHHQLIQDWIRDNKDLRFDLAIFGDVLEHLERQEAIKILDSAVRIFSNIIICVPLRNIFQGDEHGNPLEIHKSYINETFFDNFYIREKHIVMAERDQFMMNIWIVNWKENKIKKRFFNLFCLFFGWRVIFFLKKVLVRYDFYDEVKNFFRKKGARKQ